MFVNKILIGESSKACGEMKKYKRKCKLGEIRSLFGWLANFFLWCVGLFGVVLDNKENIRVAREI